MFACALEHELVASLEPGVVVKSVGSSQAHIGSSPGSATYGLCSGHIA